MMRPHRIAPHRLALLCALLLVAACSSGGTADSQPASTAASTAAGAEQASPTVAADESDPREVPATTDEPTTSVERTATTTTTTIRTTTPTTTTPKTTTTMPATTTTVPTSTPYGMPVADGARAGYGRTHSEYPATDVFVPAGCGSPIISPVNGVVLETRRVDGWDRRVDNPATRGGQSVAIRGDDGVRYYFAHFESIAADIEPGARIELGHLLGLMGRTGRAGACHLHFSISPPCPGKEWSVRRGVVWPWRYLDAWRRGEQLSPLAEVEVWVATYPDGCAWAMADPNAADS